MEKPKDKHIRKFLNKKGFHTTACIIAEAAYEKNGSWLTLLISDCSRQINIDLGASTKSQFNNVKSKLRILRKSIEMLEEELEVSWKWETYLNSKKR